ncbi:hypothetical protein ACFZ8E_22645 [Methylobacterium sp. HMF5984]|uniref:hypothetical protein n=1 Tax=unclassified Methylobacterium TaxID=2615210 RepID=UPI001FB93733|nr:MULTISPECIES: hypothetical protein [unclassified Methylobacterium]MCJ2006183.1 hypothetical protein [Methylobacterium sp. J-092]MCJ2075455.1 hypothetical protein [Methylobacterium sp. E-016]
MAASPLPASPSTAAGRLRRPLALTATALCLGAALAGCQALGGALGGGGGVMPAAEVGPPPSLRGALPGREARMANVDSDGRPLATAPTRTLDLPKDKRNDARAANDGARRIRREEIDGEPTSGGSSGGMTPSLTPGGSVGLGGKF